MKPALLKQLRADRSEAVTLIDLISRVDLIANSLGMDRAIYFEQMLMPLSQGLVRVGNQIEQLDPSDDFPDVISDVDNIIKEI